MGQELPSGLVIVGLVVGMILALGWLAERYPAFRQIGTLVGLG